LFPFCLFQHDAQLDYYGKRLATCSSDRTIRIFNVVDGKPVGEGVVLKGLVHSLDNFDLNQLCMLIAVCLSHCRHQLCPCELYLCRHTAPVWQVSWAHPSFGTLIASCSYDSRVYIWKEIQPASTGGAATRGKSGGSSGEWEKIKEVVAHSASGMSSKEVFM
jgi:protein transport protein SEC13